MLNTTVSKLRCPRCDSRLELSTRDKARSGAEAEVHEVRSGQLKCLKCKLKFPILAGVAILAENVGDYLYTHVKGIAKLVKDSEIPKEYIELYQEAKSELQVEHIEEDLEADRVTALYLMNHYLHVDGKSAADRDARWWAPRSQAGSPLIDQLVRSHWDHGPFAQIKKWVQGLGARAGDVVEVGCGLGGLYPRLRPFIKSYLGVDSSFASIALARHLALGMNYPAAIGIPEDLIDGPIPRKPVLPEAGAFDGRADFIVGDIARPPLELGVFDLSLALNTIDMLDDPATLPKLQHQLLRRGGTAIQSCPYIWHEVVAKRLRAKLKAGGKRGLDSALTVEWLYEQRGFKIEQRVEHLPWLFLKHSRQLEIYSVHLFTAIKD